MLKMVVCLFRCLAGNLRFSNALRATDGCPVITHRGTVIIHKYHSTDSEWEVEVKWEIYIFLNECTWYSSIVSWTKSNRTENNIKSFTVGFWKWLLEYISCFRMFNAFTIISKQAVQLSSNSVNLWVIITPIYSFFIIFPVESQDSTALHFHLKA